MEKIVIKSSNENLEGNRWKSVKAIVFTAVKWGTRAINAYKFLKNVGLVDFIVNLF